MSYNYIKFKFSDDQNFMILRTLETFNSTNSGFQTKPCEVKKEIIPSEYYTNYIASIPFFNNFGYGATCRAYWQYTRAGNLPTRVTSVSPGRKEKKVATFKFIDKYSMLKAAGWRERDIIERATTFELKHEDSSQMLYIYCDDGYCIYDTIRKTFRG